MKDFLKQKFTREMIPQMVIIFIVILSFEYFIYDYFNIRNQNYYLKLSNMSLDEANRFSEMSVNKNLELNKYLTDLIMNEQGKSSSLQQELGKISGTVSTLEKLSRLDPELLKKYSKVFFLNENYVPTGLLTIDSEFLYNKSKPLLFHAGAMSHLRNLLQSANDDGTNLRVISAFRSFGEQEVLKSEYKVVYGAGTANSFSADQGYSEHQLGTTVDLTTTITGVNFSKFEKTPAFIWLTENAYKFGFILSYPKNNTYYKYEPWHWRYVGVALATRLHEDNKYFYDLEQRNIDKYLINIFD